MSKSRNTQEIKMMKANLMEEVQWQKKAVNLIETTEKMEFNIVITAG